MSIEELEKKIEKNAIEISNNADKINNNLKHIKKNKYALDILKDYKNESIRWFIALKRVVLLLIIVLFMWFVTIGYLIYTLNDIGTIEKNVTQDNTNGYNNYIGNDGDITNGTSNN